MNLTILAMICNPSAEIVVSLCLMEITMVCSILGENINSEVSFLVRYSCSIILSKEDIVAFASLLPLASASFAKLKRVIKRANQSNSYKLSHTVLRTSSNTEEESLYSHIAS